MVYASETFALGMDETLQRRFLYFIFNITISPQDTVNQA